MALRGKRDLEKDDFDVSINEFLVSLYKSDEDLPLKTRIYNPKDLASLKTLGIMIKPYFDPLSKLLGDWIRYFEEYEVSHDGEGRREGIKAVSSLMDKETIRMTLGEKLTTNLKK